MSIAINAFIFCVTAVWVTGCFRKDGKWNAERGKNAFRYFTVQSNTLCAAGALLTALSRTGGSVPAWVWVLKYAGTAAVTVTMMTVLIFLGPKHGYRPLLKVKDGNFFLHLLTPLMALASFCVFEKRGMSLGTALWGMAPVAFYGPLYLYKILYAPEGKRWEDFYGFNAGGKWPVSYAAMVAGAFLICMGIMGLQNV